MILSQVYCVWQVVKTPTIILNNPVYPSSSLAIRLVTTFTNDMRFWLSEVD